MQQAAEIRETWHPIQHDQARRHSTALTPASDRLAQPPDATHTLKPYVLYRVCVDRCLSVCLSACLQELEEQERAGSSTAAGPDVNVDELLDDPELERLHM